MTYKVDWDRLDQICRGVSLTDIVYKTTLQKDTDIPVYTNSSGEKFSPKACPGCGSRAEIEVQATGKIYKISTKARVKCSGNKVKFGRACPKDSTLYPSIEDAVWWWNVQGKPAGAVVKFARFISEVINWKR